MADGVKLVCASCAQANRVPADRIGSGPVCGTCGAKLADGSVAAIDLATLEKMARTDGLPLLVDFWAPWCGPCRAMAPEFARAGLVMRGNVRLAKIDTQSHPDASVRFAIRGIPALILFSGGREVARVAGARPAAQIESFVQDALARAGAARARV